jgi:hypothetical protein
MTSQPKPMQKPQCAHAGRRAGSHHHEIDSLARFECTCRHECRLVCSNKSASSKILIVHSAQTASQE